MFSRLPKYIYVIFDFDNFGYNPGDIVKVKLNTRDDKGVHVTLPDKTFGKVGPANAWSDLGCFRELTGMEFLAHAAEGRLLL